MLAAPGRRSELTYPGFRPEASSRISGSARSSAGWTAILSSCQTRVRTWDFIAHVGFLKCMWRWGRWAKSGTQGAQHFTSSNWSKIKIDYRSLEAGIQCCMALPSGAEVRWGHFFLNLLISQHDIFTSATAVFTPRWVLIVSCILSISQSLNITQSTNGCKVACVGSSHPVRSNSQTCTTWCQHGRQRQRTLRGHPAQGQRRQRRRAAGGGQGS